MWINQQFATGSVQIQVKLIAFSNDRHRNLIMWGAQFKKNKHSAFLLPTTTDNK